ncbi:O-Antigen ligase family protein [Methyloversatilis sp. RAC08]|uniref:O-antigen ligase family protein n=1 Tax=Methyloversatilis sp. RAC08 TaxID=1842540 RepID=UPI00083D0DE8|nr:O-antigen ligase family protein [Methyloversatilis sp. RAC08]AOF82169.1 O-Antigen ligase family protein [Methyloversatilis sp. RAC08]
MFGYSLKQGSFVLFAVFFGAFLALALVLTGPIPPFILLLPVLALSVFAIPRQEGVNYNRLFLLTIGWLVFTLLWPRYVSFRLPGVPDILPGRVLFGLLLVMWIFLLVNSKTLWADFAAVVRRHRFVFGIFFAYVALRLLSAVFSRYFVNSAYVLLNELLTYFPLIAIGAIVFSTAERLRYLMMAFAGTAIALGALGVMEAALGKNIFAAYLPGFFSLSSEYLEQIVQEKIRGGSYRVQGTFGHPLLYAQFLLFATPFVALFLNPERKFRSFLILLALAVIGVAVVRSGSRSAVIGAVIVGMLWLALALFGQIIAKTTSRMSWLALFAVPLVLTSAVLIALQSTDYVIGRDRAEYNSSNARVEMYLKGFEVTSESPAVGHGPGLAIELMGFVGTGGVRTLDSYYVSVMVESGFLAISAFLLFGISGALVAAKVGLTSRSAFNRAVGRSIACAIVGVMLMCSILSTPHNLPFYFLLIGVSLALKQVDENDARESA